MMESEYRCFHSRTPEEQESVVLGPETTLDGVVACQHRYGVGVYLPTLDAWGHVDITALGVGSIYDDFSSHPALGARLQLRVLGRNALAQLRLTVE